jgi:predicted Zn-dependent protease
MAALRQLRLNLEQQAPDPEHVPTPPLTGSFTWDHANKAFEEVYAPDLIYPVIAKHANAVRRIGQRLTGYIEAQERHDFTVGWSPVGVFDLRQRDHGLTFSVTVDADGAVGSTSGASIYAPAPALDQLLGEAIEESSIICAQSRHPEPITPGDYTVILHPAAVSDLLNTTLYYGLFDQRKIDEGRTFLSRHKASLQFPAELRLEHSTSLATPTGYYCDGSLNARLLPSQDLSLIAGGTVCGFYVSPYWAQQQGSKATCTPADAPPLVLRATEKSALTNNYQQLQDLISQTERGIYVANLWYLRMVSEMDGIITGMTRDGLFEIRDGKLMRPLINMRWHDNPLRMLSAVSGMTASQRLFGLSRLAGRNRTMLTSAPALRIENFHFSSVSKF